MALKKQILTRILNQFPSGQPVSADDLSKADIPPALRHFLYQALSRRVRQELKHIHSPKSDWIDSTSKLYGDAYTGLKEVLSDLGQFPADDVELYFGRAVEFVVDYLYFPVDTLIDFLFIRDADMSRAADIERRLVYFTVYPHLITEVNDVVTDASADRMGSATSEISRVVLRERLTACDRSAGSCFSAGDWMDTLKPLCKLYSFGAGLPGQFPLDLPVRFIEERGLLELADSLRRCEAVEGEMIHIETLVRLLQDAFRPPPPSVPVDKSQEVNSASEAGPDLPLWKQYTEEAAHVTATTITADPSDSRPLWKTYATPESEPSAPQNEPSVPESEPSAPQNEPSAPQNEPSAPQNEPSVPENPTLVEGLEARVLGEARNLRSRFISDLFSGNTDAYESVIELLSRSNGWDKAAKILKTEVFVKYRVDIYSESAIAFTNAVEDHIKQFNTN